MGEVDEPPPPLSPQVKLEPVLIPDDEGGEPGRSWDDDDDELSTPEPVQEPKPAPKTVAKPAPKPAPKRPSSVKRRSLKTTKLPASREGLLLAQYELIALALAEKVLLDGSTEKTFRAEDVSEVAWLRFPKTFGIKGGKYPCTNTVYVKLLRARALGLIDRVNEDSYQVTKRLMKNVESLCRRLRDER